MKTYIIYNILNQKCFLKLNKGIARKLKGDQSTSDKGNVIGVMAECMPNCKT